jgi:aspartate-semialdehyde dehydrogenase
MRRCGLMNAAVTPEGWEISPLAAAWRVVWAMVAVAWYAASMAATSAPKICILGATGVVGGELLTLIGRAWPDAQLSLFASRARTLTRDGRALEIHAATDLEGDDAPRGDVAFVALDDDHSARFVPRLLDLGYRVVDKSNTFRMDPEIPLVVAGVNHTRVGDSTTLVANPNCTTIPFALAVKPLKDHWGLESASVSTYQAISGAGVAALDEFLGASKSGYTDADRMGLGFDPAAYAGNVVPHNGKTDASGFSSEERKLVNEGRKILEDASLGLCAQCCRVPVAVGHYETAWVTLGKAASLPDIAGALESAPYVRFLPGAAGEGLTALATVHDRDRALVGRLRLDPRDATGRTVCLTIAGDNLRLGAATNAIRIASRWLGSADPALGLPA